MSTNHTDNGIVVSETKKGWRYHLRGWRKFALLAIAIILAGGTAYWWFAVRNTTDVRDTSTITIPETKIPEPTAEQRHIITQATQGEGTIISINENSITLQLNDQAKQLTLKTSSETFYSSGSKGFSTERATVKPGQKAIVGYDKQYMTAMSVWVDYDGE